MPEVKVTKLTQVNGADERGGAQQQIRVDYTVDSHGPFTHTFPKEGFDAQKVTQVLTEFARQVSLLPK